MRAVYQGKHDVLLEPLTAKPRREGPETANSREEGLAGSVVDLGTGRPGAHYQPQAQGQAGQSAVDAKHPDWR